MILFPSQNKYALSHKDIRHKIIKMVFSYTFASYYVGWVMLKRNPVPLHETWNQLVSNEQQHRQHLNISTYTHTQSYTIANINAENSIKQRHKTVMFSYRRRANELYSFHYLCTNNGDEMRWDEENLKREKRKRQHVNLKMENYIENVTWKILISLCHKIL